MPFSIIGSALSIGSSLLGGGDSSGSGPTGSGGSAYVPQGLSQADTDWQAAYARQKALADQQAGKVQPLYDQTLAAQQGINYDPYLQAGTMAGQQYGMLGNLAQQQMGQYGAQAGLAGQQQQNLYGMANQVGQTAFDPQNALYGRTAQQVQDQVRSGQAARGLGVSPVGAALENQAMSNFNIDWQNQQLQRQAEGMRAMAQGSQAGAGQGQLYGANLAAQMQSGQQMPQFTQQAAATPLQSQQYVAGMPAQNAMGYQQGMQNVSNLYGNLQNQAIPYLFQGVGAQQAQQMFNSQQNAAQAQMFGNLGAGLEKSYNTPGSWMNTTFGGGQAPAPVSDATFTPVNSSSGGGYYGGVSGDLSSLGW